MLNKAADAEKSEFECPSTEALQAKVEELNRRLTKEAFENGYENEKNIVAGSLDFKAWYPSLKKEVVVPTIRKRLETGPATINVNDLELARFLFVMMEEEEIKAEGLEDVIHTLKDPAQRKPRLTDQEMVGGDDFRTGPKSKLNPPKEKPNEAQRKKMVAIGLAKIVEKVMSNFLYTFGGEDRRQGSGGPTGDVLTQAIARHMGNEFDQEINTKLASLNVRTELYQRYADDVDLVVRSVGRNIKFCPLTGTMQEKTAREIHEESHMEEDEITMQVMKQIADTITKHIETEYDCPSRHPELGFKVPVLDLAVWVEDVEVAPPRLETQQLHNLCCDDICLPVGLPRPHPADHPTCSPHYTPPVYRGGFSGRSINNSALDTQLIQPFGSQGLSLQSDAALSAPHPTPGPCGPGRLCRSRPCRCNIEQSQLAHLAPRASQPRDQDVGLLPPIHTRKVQQVMFEFYAKPMTAKKVILATSAQSWGQKRSTLTQELIRRLLNCSKSLSCATRKKHLNNYMQLLKNSGYSEKFRLELLRSGLQGYNKILEAERDGVRPVHRPKGWKESARWLEKKRKKNNWLGSFWKSCIFVPPTTGSELKKRMQDKEEELRAGGREKYPIKIIETAGRTLEQTLVNTDPFSGNQCTDEKCEVKKNPKNKISCRRNCICYRVTCILCLQAGRPADVSNYLKSPCYFGQSAKNMHCRAIEHVSKFNSKSEKLRAESTFFKHLMNSHGGKSDGKNFSDYFLPKGWKLNKVSLLVSISMMLTIQAKIVNISTNHSNPKWAAGRLKEVIEENVKLVNRRTQTMLLEDLVRRKIPLKDVISIEEHQRWQGRGRKDVQLIDFLMKKKLRSAILEEKKLYAENLDRNRRKKEHLKAIKDRDRGGNDVERLKTMFGVKVGDEELGEYVEKEANVWGQAEIGDEAKEVLNLGKKFRLHQKLDSIATKTEIEKGLTIVRWNEKENEDEGSKAEEEEFENEQLMNRERKIVDMTSIKATDMKFNRRIYAPNAAPEKLESNLQQTKEALEEVFEKYKKEKADEKGNIRETNLTDSQAKGLRELKEKTKKGLVVMPTDKTMGLSIETKESYKAAAEVHVKDDEKIK